MNYCYGCMYPKDSEGICPHCGFDETKHMVYSHQLPMGTVLHDRYLVGKVMGEGGFGITYIGLDQTLELRVAIKEFYMTGFVNRNNSVSFSVSAEIGKNEELFQKNRAKFYSEAKTLAKFSRVDGIVNIRDFFNENDTAYIIMDYLEGKTLKNVLKEKKKLSVEETLSITKPIFSALSAIHKTNIIHRDISPDNIIISTEGKIYLIDFGAARAYSEDEIKSLSVILKPGYAPEEQYRTKGVQGPWTDLYALSATMYRCISGKRPEDSLERLAMDSLPQLCDAEPSCSKELSDIIMKGLAVRAENRYQSAAEMADDIRNIGKKKEVPVVEEPKEVIPKEESKETEAPITKEKPENVKISENAETPEKPEIPVKAETPEKAEIPVKEEKPEKEDISKKEEIPEKKDIPVRGGVSDSKDELESMTVPISESVSTATVSTVPVSSAMFSPAPGSEKTDYLASANQSVNEEYLTEQHASVSGNKGIFPMKPQPAEGYGKVIFHVFSDAPMSYALISIAKVNGKENEKILGEKSEEKVYSGSSAELELPVGESYIKIKTKKGYGFTIRGSYDNYVYKYTIYYPNQILHVDIHIGRGINRIQLRNPEGR